MNQKWNPACVSCIEWFDRAKVPILVPTLAPPKIHICITTRDACRWNICQWHIILRIQWRHKAPYHALIVYTNKYICQKLFLHIVRYNKFRKLNISRLLFCSRYSNLQFMILISSDCRCWNILFYVCCRYRQRPQ